MWSHKKHFLNQMTHCVTHNEWVLELNTMYNEKVISRCDEVHLDDVLYRCIIGQKEENDFDALWIRVHPPLLQRQSGFLDTTEGKYSVKRVLG